MKEKYIEPVVDIVVFETEDIITTSGYGLTAVDGFPADDDGWGNIIQ
jgi:hypothetical protein